MSTYHSNQPPQHIVVHSAKESWLAYVLWFFLGNVGIHKFYLRQNVMGIVYLGLSLLGWATVWFLVGFVFLVPLWIMMFIDLFTMPGRVRQLNSALPYQSGVRRY